MNIAFSGKVTIDGSEYELDVTLKQTREPAKPEAPKPVVPTTNARLLKVPEVASILGIGRTQVYELLRRGETPGIIRFGHPTRINSEALQRWIRERAEQE